MGLDRAKQRKLEEVMEDEICFISGTGNLRWRMAFLEDQLFYNTSFYEKERVYASI